MNHIFLAFLRASMTGGLLILLILSLRLILKQRAGLLWRQVAYALLALHLLLPLSLGSPLSIYAYAPETVREAVAEELTPAALPYGQRELGIAEAVLPTPEEAGREVDKPPAAWLVPSIWLLGAGLYLISRAILARRYRKLLVPYTATDGARLPVLLDQARREMGLRKTPRLMTGPLGVATQGLVRPCILIPTDAAAHSDEILLMALRHECAHIRRRDVARLHLLTLITALHWWNPLVYLLARAVRKDIELACDADVLARLDHADALPYGRAIIAMAAAPATALRPAFTDPSLKERITMIKKPMKRKTAITLLTAALCAVLAISLLTLPIAKAEKQYGKLLSYEEVLAQWLPGETKTVMDIETQTEFQVTRTNTRFTRIALDAAPMPTIVVASDGSRSEILINAFNTKSQVLPASQEDERIMKELFGGDWVDTAHKKDPSSYRPMAVLLGDEWVAASLNGVMCYRTNTTEPYHLNMHFLDSLAWIGDDADLIYAIDEGRTATVRVALDSLEWTVDDADVIYAIDEGHAATVRAAAGNPD